MSQEKETPHFLTLSQAVGKVIEEWKSGETSLSKRLSGFLIIQLKKDVRSGSFGTTHFEYVAPGSYGRGPKKTSYYRFATLSWDWNSSDKNWELSWRLCCFESGGNESQKFDSLTALNFLSAHEVLDALHARVRMAGASA